MASVIEIKDLKVGYGSKRVLDGLDLSVRQGEIFGFLGPNGAGKSTTIKAILGLLPPVSGSVTLHGLNSSDPRSRSRVGYLPEETTYYRFLTATELLQFYGDVCGVPRDVQKNRIPVLLETVGLSHVARKRLDTFSKGMVQKVGLAQALVNDPETLILDEPTSGLDPLARMDLREVLKNLRAVGKTVFFSSHELSEVELLCDTIAIVKHGKLIKSGPTRQVLGAGTTSLEKFFLETIGERV